VVDEDRKAAADVIAAAVFVVEEADVVMMVGEVLEREVVDGLVGAGLGGDQWINLEDIVGARSNADEAAEDEIDVGGVEVVMRARQSYDGRAGIGVVILLDVGIARR
jgi:hypothetical protein